MTHAVDVLTVVLFGGTSLFYLALGIWVLTLEPRRRETWLLSAFAILFAVDPWPPLAQVVLHLEVSGIGLTLLDMLLRHGITTATLVSVAIAASVAGGLEDRRLLGATVLGALVLAAVETSTHVLEHGLTEASVAATVAGTLLPEAGQWAAAGLLALRADPARKPAIGKVTQLAILGLAFALFWAVGAGLTFADLPRHLVRGEPVALIHDLAFVGPWLLVAGLWGWNMVRSPPESVRIHRAVMLAILVTVLAGAVLEVAIPDASADLLFPVAALAGVGLLAYGVLRHDLAGLDAKVEWTVSKTTVAGVFIAVFFIVSEGAQVLFAGFAGSELLGIIAAGALLFALSPIQRLADRIAEEVVPGGGPAGDERDDESYRRAVRLALTDGEITRDEERELADLADQLGISAGRALELREQVEDEVDAGGDAG